jgi:mevalonate kinase
MKQARERCSAWGARVTGGGGGGDGVGWVRGLRVHVQPRTVTARAIALRRVGRRL